MPCATPSGVSSNSICMSMTCVMPAFATFAMLSDVQIPPPTAIRSVNHVISHPVLCRLFCGAGWVPHSSRSLRRVGIFNFGPTQTATDSSRRTAPPHSTVSFTPAQRLPDLHRQLSHVLAVNLLAQHLACSIPSH